MQILNKNDTLFINGKEIKNLDDKSLINEEISLLIDMNKFLINKLEKIQDILDKMEDDNWKWNRERIIEVIEDNND